VRVTSQETQAANFPENVSHKKAQKAQKSAETYFEIFVPFCGIKKLDG
jgi:hypothetical protein